MSYMLPKTFAMKLPAAAITALSLAVAASAQPSRAGDRPGDVVRIPPGEKHWHGATPSNGMSHFAISEQLNGKGVDWLEKVSEQQYRRP